MYHPLIDNYTSLKDADLELKILDLSKKYGIAARMGQGSVCQQILVVLETYKEEQRKRQKQSLENVVKKQNKDFDDLINVE